MSKKLIIGLSLLMLAGSIAMQAALAAKPDKASGLEKQTQQGQTKLQKTEKKQLREASKSQEKSEKALKKSEDDQQNTDSAKGLEKQRIKKADQERKELGKGSEQGQAAREEHSKKWWKFWE